MLKIEDINAAIAEREKETRLSDELCQELSWLYIIRNEMTKNSPLKPISSLYSQVNDKTIITKRKTKSVLNEEKHLTREQAEEWASEMKNVDGTKGPHWTMDQVKQVMAQKNVELPVNAFFLAINNIFSDFSAVAKELGVNSMDFYVKMAKAFLNDPDGPGADKKIEKYFEYVVH